MSETSTISEADVRAFARVQSVVLSDARYGEIAIEATRLRAGVDALADRLDFFAEPPAFPTVLREHADVG